MVLPIVLAAIHFYTAALPFGIAEAYDQMPKNRVQYWDRVASWKAVNWLLLGARPPAERIDGDRKPASRGVESPFDAWVLIDVPARLALEAAVDSCGGKSMQGSELYLVPDEHQNREDVGKERTYLLVVRGGAVPKTGFVLRARDGLCVEFKRR